MYKQWAEETMQRILKKLDVTADEIGPRFPHVCKDKEYDNEQPRWWTNGFWPGILWMAYQQTSKKKFAEIAAEAENKMAYVLDEYYDVDHDAGFIWLLSAGADYRITGSEESKRRCMKAAAYLASWDFRVPRTPETPRDTSAAACAACGLLEIAEHVPECEKEFYIDSTYKIVKSLTDNYSNLDSDKQCILNCGTGHCPAGQNVNVGLIYGDYFYMEAVSRLMGNTDIFWYKQ